MTGPNPDAENLHAGEEPILRPAWRPRGPIPEARPSISWHVFTWSGVDLVTECEDFVMLLNLDGRLRFAMNRFGDRLP